MDDVEKEGRREIIKKSLECRQFEFLRCLKISERRGKKH